MHMCMAFLKKEITEQKIYEPTAICNRTKLILICKVVRNHAHVNQTKISRNTSVLYDESNANKLYVQFIVRIKYKY